MTIELSDDEEATDEMDGHTCIAAVQGERTDNCCDSALMMMMLVNGIRRHTCDLNMR